MKIPDSSGEWREELGGFWCEVGSEETDLSFLKESSIVTLSPVNPPEAKKYNIYGKEIKNHKIVIHCDSKPLKPLLYNALIENYI